MTNSINGAPRNRSDIQSGQNTKNNIEKDTSGSSSSQQAGSSSSTETVSITNEANKIRELQSSLVNIPDINQAKVDAIKEEIANGNYPIDHERIASNLLDLEKSLS